MNVVWIQTNVVFSGSWWEFQSPESKNIVINTYWWNWSILYCSL